MSIFHLVIEQKASLINRNRFDYMGPHEFWKSNSRRNRRNIHIKTAFIVRHAHFISSIFIWTLVYKKQSAQGDKHHMKHHPIEIISTWKRKQKKNRRKHIEISTTIWTMDQFIYIIDCWRLEGYKGPDRCACECDLRNGRKDHRIWLFGICVWFWYNCVSNGLEWHVFFLWSRIGDFIKYNEQFSNGVVLFNTIYVFLVRQ